MNTEIFSKENTIFSKFMSGKHSTDKSQEESSLVDEGKVKSRLFSAWNNFKYGMKLKTNFSKESPVWLLGECYRRIESSSADSTELGTDVAAFQSTYGLSNNEDECLEAFKKDFTTRLWLTYRREFPILNGSNYSSDCGWGCMIRSGQMLMAQALVCHFLSRDWRWGAETTPISREDCIDMVNHRKIIKWFGDKPSKNSPLSLHVLVNLGEKLGKKAGDWYAPGFVAHLFRQAVQLASKENYEFDSLNVCVAQDCAVYIGDILSECRTVDGKWKSLILLVPVRMGAEKFNLIYAPYLTALFSLKQCIGIIGGRPKHSLYFVGYQDDKLIHLDPHYCQEVVNVWEPDFPLHSFHCNSPRKMQVNKMDPSCCIGFYCKTEQDFYSLLETAQCLMNSDGSNGTGCSLFTFCEGFSKDARASPKSTLVNNSGHYSTSEEVDDFETDDFEII